MDNNTATLIRKKRVPSKKLIISSSFFVLIVIFTAYFVLERLGITSEMPVYEEGCLETEIPLENQPLEDLVEKKGYFNALFIDEGVSKNLLAIIELDIISYEVIESIIYLEMIWYLEGKEFEVTAFSNGFYFSQGLESKEYLFIDSKEGLDSYLRLDYKYSGNFAVEGIESFDESFWNEYLERGSEFEYELKFLNLKLPTESS